MSLSQLRYFVAVAEEGHMGRAAARLHVSQPPLSRHIKALEDELGTQLFERTAKGMRILQPGECLLRTAKRVLAELDRVAEDVRRSAASERQGAQPPGQQTRELPEHLENRQRSSSTLREPKSPQAPAATHPHPQRQRRA